MHYLKEVNIVAGIIIHVILVSFCCISCTESPRYDDMRIYDVEVVNYFYETTFRMDGGQILEEAYRWKENIPVSLHGILWENDSLFVLSAIQDINSLELPISLTLTSDSVRSKLKIIFGNDNIVTDSINRREINKETNFRTGFSGEGRLKLSDAGEILSGEISIFNKSSVYDNLDSIQRSVFRKRVILEEIYQSMGIPGDSFTYYNSITYEGKNFTDSLSVLDKDILKFLYRKYALDKRIRRIKFEEQYADVLYNNLNAEKLKILSTEYGLEKDDLNSLKNMIFLGDSNKHFPKFPRDIFYKLEGTYTSAEVEFFKILIAELNNSIPHLNGIFTEENTFWNESPTLTIHIECRQETGKGATVISTYLKNKDKLLYDYRLNGIIKIVLPDLEQKYKNRLITFAVIRGLGLEVTDGNVLKDSSLDNLRINDKYQDYLQFLYDPRFPSGMSKIEYERLIKEMK